MKYLGLTISLLLLLEFIINKFKNKIIPSILLFENKNKKKKQIKSLSLTKFLLVLLKI